MLLNKQFLYNYVIVNAISAQPIQELWIFLQTSNFIYLSSDGSIRLFGMKSIIDNPNSSTHSMIKDISPAQ